MDFRTLTPGVQAGELLAPHTERRQPPSNMDNADAELFSHELVRRFEACSVIAMDELSMTRNSWWQMRHWRFVDDFCASHGVRQRRLLGRLRDLANLPRPASTVSEGIWAHNNCSDNYFRWLTDVLPKLQAWKEAKMPCRTLLLPSVILQRGFVSESLLKLGFNAEAVEPPIRMQIGRLWVIEETAPTGNFRSDLLQRLRKALLYPAPEALSPRRWVYISRGDAQRRSLVNETEIVAVLKGYGVEVVQLEGRSLKEQIELFRRCDLLVGLHGAGLTNMLWMPPGSRVLEIRQRGDNHNNCYYAMASALGHSYNYLQADDCIPNQSTYAAKLTLPPKALIQWFHNTLEEQLP
jgi:capsular polysaccharide biosynthesis protein